MKHSNKQRPRDVAPVPRYGSPGSLLSSVSYGYLSGIKQNYNSRFSDPINPSTVRDPRFRGGRLPPLPTDAWARQRWHDFFWRRTGGRFGMSVPVNQNEAKEEGRKIGQAAGYIVGLYKAFERPASGAVLPSQIARIGVNMFNNIIDKHNAKIREQNRERYAQHRGKRMMTKNAQQRQVRHTSMIKQSAGRYPLGTLKLLAQTMPKEIRSLRLAQTELQQAGSAIAGVRDQRVKEITAVLRRLDAKLRQQIVARQREFKEIAQELKQRGESASDIVGLYGRRSASSKLDIGPINIRIRNPKQIAKIQSQIRELKSKIKLTEQQIKMDISTAKQIKRAADFLGNAAHELELAENMIPGTQMGTLTLQFGNAMRRMAGAYQAMQSEIKGNQAALNSMQQQEKKLNQALQRAGG